MRGDDRHRMSFHGLAGFAAGLVVAGATAVAITSYTHAHTTDPGTTMPTTTRSVSGSSAGDAQQVYDGAKQSVAFITAETPEGTATGSGFVVSSDGKIVTNEHVVDGAQQVTVKLGTSNEDHPATVLAADASKDLALLKIDTGGRSLVPLKFDDSSKVQVGQTTYAIGNPFGLDHTFTSGIVSAVGRAIQAPDGTPIENAIQTDAAINPGNSGGALLDANGRVIGINSQIASGGSDGNVGIGFAIPSNTVADYIAHPTSTQQTQSPDQGLFAF
jgi:putative serine protease PepD